MTPYHPSMVTRAAGLAFALTLLASGGSEAQSWRAWSDALALPDVQQVRAELETRRNFGCGAARSVNDLLRETQAKFDALPADSPLRPTYQTVITSLRQAAAQENLKPQPAAPSSAPLSLDAALQNTRQWLQQHDAAGMQAFAASEDARDPKKAKEAALGAALAGKPNAAAAALLEAHRLMPADAEVLVNLGGALAVLNLSSEALAVLNAAEHAGLPSDGALGWSPQAVALNNKGLALLNLGQAVDAEQALRQAVKLTPDLAEARGNLSRALTCAGKFDEAVKFARSSMRRTAQPSEPATPGEDRGGGLPAEVTQEDDPDGQKETSLPIGWVFDVSRGKSMNLPNLKLPLTPAEAVELHGNYVKLSQALGERQLTLMKQQDQLRQAVQARESSEPTLVRQRRAALTSALYRAAREPRIRPLWDEAYKAGSDASNLWSGFWHCEGGCQIDTFITQAGKSGDYKQTLRALCIPALSSANNSWRSAMQLYATHLAKATEAEYRLQSGLAANSSDPQWHQMASLIAESTAVSSLASLVGQAEQWSGDIVKFQDVCVEGQPEAKVEQVAPPLVVEQSSLCTGALDKLSLSVSFKVVQVAVSCDKASLKLATPGWIGAFAKLDKSFTKGNITVAAGAEAGAELPLTSAGVKAGGGFYVTLSPELEFEDVGIQAEAKASLAAKAGPIKIGESVKGFSGRWSLIAAPPN